MRRLRWLVLPLLGYLLIMGLMKVFERPLLFPAPPVTREQLSSWAVATGAAELSLPTSDGETLYGWRVGEGEGLVLLFSGNGSTVGGYPERYRRFNGSGLAVVHVNYRGYPGSTGEPDEPGLRIDARTAWEEARRTHAADRIVVMGSSLGGGVAVGLVAGLEDQPAALVLESTFTAAVDVAADSYPWLPVRWLMSNHFDSLALAPRVRCPTVVMHGIADTLIPVEQGRTLAAAIEGARFVEVPGAGHGDDLLADSTAWRAVRGVLP